MSREGERKETGSLPPKGVRAPDWRSLIHCLSLLCLTFQIDISEDDIDDGFRRLFAQLAGEVGVPQISMLWTLLDAKENSLCSQGDFSLKGERKQTDQKQRGFANVTRVLLSSLACVLPTSQALPFLRSAPTRYSSCLRILGATCGCFCLSVPLQLRHGTWPLILDFHKNIWGGGRVLNLKNASNLQQSIRLPCS